MTEEKKQELKQLLTEAMASLKIRYGYDVPLPSHVREVYRKYLQECWTHYGVDLLSFLFSIRLGLDTVDETTKKLHDFIKEELVLFIDEDATPDFMGDYILNASYVIESDPTDGSRLNRLRSSYFHVYLLLKLLLEIAFVRGIKEAVSTFDRCSCPEGAHDFFQNVALLEGIRLKTEVQVFEGVRLVPLPSPEKSGGLAHNLPYFPMPDLFNQLDFFRGITLLVIDRPGFSIFHKPVKPFQGGFPNGLPIDDLPFQLEEYKVKFPNSKTVNSFEEFFCQVLSLVCNTTVQIVHKRWFLAEDKSFNLHDGTIRILRDPDSFGSPTEANESQIDEAKNLYDILVNLGPKVREKLQIAVDRWVKSKTDENPVDKMIDLGIAFESLYLSDVREELTFRLCVRAAWYLGKDKKDRERLLTEFKKIYSCRSTGVHNGTLDEDVTIGGEHIPISKFVKRAQDLCRQSIIKVLEDGRFPDWDNLILGDEVKSDAIGLDENPGGLG